MSSPITAVFEATIGLLVNEGRDELAEKLNEGDVTDQKFRDLTVCEIDEVKLKLDSLARKDLFASSSRLVKEGIELLYEVFESASSSEHRVIKAAAIACAGQFNIVKETRKLDLTALDESAMRKLSGAKKRFVEARCRATELFWNEALKLCDRLSAMACRLVVTILEMIDNPTDALEACRVCLDELHQLPGVKECFKVELEGGLRACLYKEQRRQTIFSVYRLNRLVYDVMSMLGSVKRWTLPYVETGKEKVDPLHNERVLKVLKHHCVTPWALGQEAKEELKDPRGIATNSKGHFLIADNGDKTVKVFDNNGKFGFRFNPRTDDADTKLDILDVATAGEDEKIFLLVTLMKPGVEEWENEVQVFNKTADLQHRFPVWSGDWGRDKLTACGKILLLTGTWSGNVVEVYEPSGEFICRFGEGVFKDAADITATCDGCVMIVDREDQNAYLFDVKGHQLGKFNIKHERDFYYRIACHPASDHVVLAGYERETCRPAIAIYTVNGEFVRRMQLDEEVWSVNGITVTLEGHIAVALRDKHDIKVKVLFEGVGGQGVLEYPKKLTPLPGTYFSSLYPLKVTILAAVWDSSYSSIFSMELANQLARFSVKSLQVSVLIPENAYIDQWGVSVAENCGVTIVKAEKQPGFLDPIDWLYYPPEDLKTDIVIGIGTHLGRIAQHWKIRYQCKNIQIAGSEPSDIFVRDTEWCIEDAIKELSINADVPVAIGPKTPDDLSAFVRPGGKRVLNLTPGIISELSNLTYDGTKDGTNFRVLLFGGDNPQNFQEEGLELAAKIMAELNDKSYHLTYVGAGKGMEQQFANQFHQCGVPKRQLMIRCLPKMEKEWKDLFCEVDLAIMPSGDKEFGWEALLALSAGFPVLVHGESGFGKALREVTSGTSTIVDFDDAREWALRINKVRETDRKTRLEQAAFLRSNYDERYSWEKQLGSLAAVMVSVVSGMGTVSSLNLSSAGLAQWSGMYSPSNPLKVTILATTWNSNFLAIFTAQLAKQFAKVTINGVQVSVFVPENAYIDGWGMSDAENCGVTIVKAKKQPSFPNPIDWLYYQPQDLKTDIVIGIGAQLGKIAQYWRIHYQCKNIQIASSELSHTCDECIEDAKKELAINADVPVAVGTKTTDDLSASLRPEGKQVFKLTPGIISEFSNLTHDTNDRRIFRVLLVGGGNPENFLIDGLKTAADAVAELNDKLYHLIYVGARNGRDQVQFFHLFHKCGVSKSQLRIRILPKTEGEWKWKEVFCEVDLAIMPSGDKKFGLKALLALSVGLPVLVHGESGFGEALRDVTFGTSAIVDSDDAREWALRIKTIRETDRKTRLEQTAVLRSKYNEKYRWEKQCGSLVAMMFGIVSETQDVTTKVAAENEYVYDQVSGEGSHDGPEEEVEEEHEHETETKTEGDAVEEEVEVASGGVVTSEGTHLSFKHGAVHLMFPRDAVSEPTPIVVHRWKYSVRSPPLQEQEAITSNVIELSSVDSQSLKFNTKVKLSLSHGATSLRSYELVIKKLVDKEMNKWEEVDGTRDVRCREEIEDDYPSHMEIPDLFFPVAQADIIECSTYAAVCRLKASPTFTITSKGDSFSHPDYPGVTVTIPDNAVAPNAKFPLILKVQEVPSDEFQETGVFLGPILRINCFETVQFSRSITIQLPLSLRQEKVLLPDPTTCRVRVLFLKSDDQEKEWIEITDDLVKPASFDGKFIRFQVEWLSGYWAFLDGRKDTSSGDELRNKQFVNSLIWKQPRPAHFVAYFQLGSLSILNLICCPAHLINQVIGDLKREGITPCHGSSKRDMIPGHDKAFVFVSGGICPFEEKEMEDFYLKLYEDDLPFKAHLKVRLINDQHSAQVEFRNTFQSTGRNLSLCTLHLPIPSQCSYSMDFEELSRQPREKKPLFEPPISHLDAGEETGRTEVKTEANVEVVLAQGTEFGLQGVTTEESEVAGVAVEEGRGAGSHGESDEQGEVEFAENETEIKSEDDAEGEKEDLEVHEQVAGLAGLEAMEAESHGGSEEKSGEESVDETETNGDDEEGQNVNGEESGGIVTSEGTNWAIKQLGVHLMFFPNAVSEPTPIMVQRWKNSVCSPPLQEHEAITSNVIELSSMDSQDVKFNTKVKLSLSHSATNLRGYELVIKKLTDKELNKWEDLDGTKDIRSLEEIEDDFSSHVEIPDLFFPVAQADITECSTYAVVCRLKVSPTYTITSKGGSFSHPDYPGVTVTIPENAVAPSAEFPLELKVQEVPNDELQEGVVFLGPILRINCFDTVQFSRSVTIQLPISLREQQVLLPDPTTCRVRVLFLKSDDQEKEWIEITDDLGKPASFDGKFVRFQVERFSGYWSFLDWRKDTSSGDELRFKRFLDSLIWNQPRPAHFFAYFHPRCLSILNLICCPPLLKEQVTQDLEKRGIAISNLADGSSKKDMIPGRDKAFVFVSGGIFPFEEKEMEDFYLKLYEKDLPFKAHLKVRLINDQHTAQVEFRNTFQPTGTNRSLCTLYLPIPSENFDSMDFEERSRQPRAFAGDVKKGIPTDEELEDLSENIPDHWIKLGRRLGFNKELQEFDKGHDKLAEKAYAMLIAWKEREGSAATYRVLNKALCDIRVKRRDLAQRFCCN